MYSWVTTGITGRVSAVLVVALTFSCGSSGNSGSAAAGAGEAGVAPAPGLGGDAGAPGPGSPAGRPPGSHSGDGSAGGSDGAAGPGTGSSAQSDSGQGFDAPPSTYSDGAAVPLTTLSGIVPSGRLTVWNPGLNTVGGIPRRTTVCATVSPSGGDDSQQIQNAIDACPAGQVVQLAAGNFSFTGQSGMDLNSNMTLRGSVDSKGRPTTRFILSADHTGAVLGAGTGGPDENYLVQPSSLTADGVLNTNTITVDTNPGYVAGELVTINMLKDSSLFLPLSNFGTDSMPQNRAFMNKTDRFIGQVDEIQSVTGVGPYVLTFSAPLHANFTVANKAQVWRHAIYSGQTNIDTTPVQYAGIENIYVEGGASNGVVSFTNIKYSWVRNLEIFNWNGQAINFIRCFRCEYRDSYVHQTADPNPGGGGYALAIDWQSADNLVENNIHWACNKVIVMRASGGGNVIGYNYMEDGFGSGYPTIPEAGINASHFVGSHMELFEGNQGFNFAGDDVWGNALYNTVFRNNFTGLRRDIKGVTNGGSTGTPMDFMQDSGGRRMVSIGAAHDYYNFVGNVLGYANQPAPSEVWSYESTTTMGVFPAIWNIGVDDNNVGATQAQCDLTRQRTLRHGNWDFGFTNGVVWDSTIATHTLPSSLYLTSAPPVFGPNPWPWVDPTTGSLATLPARARFDAMVAAGTLY